MTINQLMETILGKACTLEGKFGDATPFTPESVGIVDKLISNLHSLGYSGNGYERMCNGMTGEMMDASIFIGPTYYQRLKHLVSDKIHCLKGDHEVLTLEGWKKIQNVTMEDKVATLKDCCLCYEKPTNILHYPDYEGDMYYIKNQAIDLAVTSNHRMWVSQIFGRQRIWKPYGFERADNLVGKTLSIKRMRNGPNQIISLFLPKPKSELLFM